MTWLYIWVAWGICHYKSCSETVESFLFLSNEPLWKEEGASCVVVGNGEVSYSNDISILEKHHHSRMLSHLSPCDLSSLCFLTHPWLFRNRELLVKLSRDSLLSSIQRGVSPGELPISASHPCWGTLDGFDVESSHAKACKSCHCALLSNLLASCSNILVH